MACKPRHDYQQSTAPAVTVTPNQLARAQIGAAADRSGSSGRAPGAPGSRKRTLR